MTTNDTTNDVRAEYIAGLRALADALEQHPELMLPYTGRLSSPMNVIPLGDEQRPQLTAWARALPGKREKQERDQYLDLIGAFHGLGIKVICDRDEVCERVVVGTETVTKTVKDPAALAAVPEVEVTEEVEVVEWRCRPLLGERDAEPVGATA